MGMKSLIVAVVVALAIPASAVASTQYYIPPGNSGGNQYVESVPSAGGSTPANRIGHSRGSGGALSPGTQSSLLQYGSTGRQTAAFANATAPGAGAEAHGGGGSHTRAAGGPVGGSGGSGGSTGPAGSSTGSGAVTPSGSSPALSVARSLTGLGGHGGFGLLPVALIAVVLAVGAIALRRRRHAS